MEQLNLSDATIILGFFDGIHTGHRRVISGAVDFGHRMNSEILLLTFKKSPAEYFKKNNVYIYNREHNYKIIKDLGVNHIIEKDFEELVSISAQNYLQMIAKKYTPKAIFTGFNYTFGDSRIGTPDYLSKYQAEYGYKYFCVNPVIYKNDTVSSTRIKELLNSGNIDEANKMLEVPFTITSEVIKGAHIGSTLGFPTANMKYPEQIVKIPFGVYKVNVFDKPAVLNWGTKPTFNGEEPILEVYIPKFEGDLYGKTLQIQILKRIRDEKKFGSIEELKYQINKDLKECSE